MIYLGSPYSHPQPDVRQRRYEKVADIQVRMLKNGFIVYSPIVNFHQLAIDYALPKDFKFWQRINFGLLRKSDELLIVKLSGWEDSVGLTAEIEFAKRLNITTNYTDYKEWF